MQVPKDFDPAADKSFSKYEETTMRRSNNTLMANDHVMNPVGTDLLGRRPSRLKPALRRTPRAGWGFIVPVLVVCAALWFLLNANHV